MDFDKMGFDTEQIAPDSENTLIPGHMITGYKMKFRSIFTLFDYDKAGQEAMLKYEEKYHIPSIHLHAEKDLSDTVAKYGLLKIRNMLLPIMEGKLKLITT